MKKAVYFFCVFFALALICPGTAFAEDGLEDYDFSEIQEFLNQNSEYQKIDFEGMVREIMTGTSKNVFRDMTGQIIRNICSEIIYNRQAMIKIILLSILSAFFTCFAEAFQTRQITDTGFFVTYTVIITVLIGSFLVFSSVAEEMIRMLLKYMEVLLPAYVLSIGVSVGAATGTGFYEFMLLLILAVDYIFLKLLIPAIKLYVVFVLVNNILKEELMSRTSELLKTGIVWCTRILIGVVVGINIVQSMVMPIADTVKGRGAYRLVSLLPGIGNGAKTVTEILMGSGILIKNAIGAAGLVVIVCIAAVPIIKMTVFAFMYRITAAIIEPVSDKRIVKSIGGVYTGAEMLMKVACVTALMFLISIVIVCMMTNKII